MPFQKGQTPPPHRASKRDTSEDAPETDIELSAPDAEQTIVPDQFANFNDDALAVAMDAYQRHKANGRTEEHAVTEGVIAAKNWSVDNKVSHRR